MARSEVRRGIGFVIWVVLTGGLFQTALLQCCSFNPFDWEHYRLVWGYFWYRGMVFDSGPELLFLAAWPMLIVWSWVSLIYLPFPTAFDRATGILIPAPRKKPVEIIPRQSEGHMTADISSSGMTAAVVDDGQVGRTTLPGPLAHPPAAPGGDIPGVPTQKNGVPKKNAAPRNEMVMAAQAPPLTAGELQSIKEQMSTQEQAMVRAFAVSMHGQGVECDTETAIEALRCTTDILDQAQAATASVPGQHPIISPVDDITDCLLDAGLLAWRDVTLSYDGHDNDSQDITIPVIGIGKEPDSELPVVIMVATLSGSGQWSTDHDKWRDVFSDEVIGSPVGPLSEVRDIVGALLSAAAGQDIGVIPVLVIQGSMVSLQRPLACDEEGIELACLASDGEEAAKRNLPGLQQVLKANCRTGELPTVQPIITFLDQHGRRIRD